MKFSRQECWSGLSFPSPGDLPDPGIEPVSPALAGRFFTTEPPGKLCGHLGSRGEWALFCLSQLSSTWFSKNSIHKKEHVIRAGMGSNSQILGDLLKQSLCYLVEHKGKNILKIKESVQRERKLMWLLCPNVGFLTCFIIRVTGFPSDSAVKNTPAIQVR